MSLPVNKAKSDAARAEGNTAFKKGRWTKSIGCYTTAILHNPDDPLAYGNRAQAYLKLDKFADAEQDCTTALAKQVGNVKALYRRALARKGLEKFSEALSDLRELLKAEVGNAAALEEIEEIETLKKRQQAAQDAKPKRPLSPPAISTKVPPTAENATVGGVDDPPSAKPEPAKSFSSLKSSRAGKKAAFVPPISPPATPIADANPTARFEKGDPSPPTNAKAKSAIPATVPPPAPQIPPASIPPTTAEKPEPIPSPSPQKAPIPPTDPHSTAAGTGILLLRALNPLPPLAGWALLRQYPPPNIPVILGPILEPDSLGVVLLALAAGSSVANDKEKVNVIMKGLKGTPRFGMNTMMLDPEAAKAGIAAWRDAGGEGQWP